jgi:hypothetical protein
METARESWPNVFISSSCLILISVACLHEALFHPTALLSGLHTISTLLNAPSSSMALHYQVVKHEGPAGSLVVKYLSPLDLKKMRLRGQGCVHLYLKLVIFFFIMGFFGTNFCLKDCSKTLLSFFYGTGT